MRATCLALLLLLLPASAYALPEVGKPAPDFATTAADGSKIHLTDYRGKITVLEWTNPYCPFVRKHYGSGNMPKLQAYALGKGVAWITINSAAPGKEGYMEAQNAAKQAQPGIPYIIDSAGIIGHLYGAKATPHMFVIDTKGKIAYMGAIDNKPTPDPTDVATARNYVRVTIDSLLAGKPVLVPSTQAYGCSVKYGD